MSETTTQETPATEAPAEQTATETTATETEVKPTETVEHWREMARLQEKRAKANADAAKRLQEIEDSQKSEAQRLADRQAQIERERDEAKAEGLRYKAAAKHGVKEDYFDLLGSDDEELIGNRAAVFGRVSTLESENEQLRSEIEALRAGKTAPTTARPTVALKPGATAETVTPAEDDSYPAHWLPQKQ